MSPTKIPRFAGTPAKRLTIHITARDHVRHGSLEVELLKRARRAKLGGATVFRGDEGFGASGHIYREHLFGEDRPLVVVIIDDPHRIDTFLDGVTDILTGAVVTVEDVEILDLAGEDDP